MEFSRDSADNRFGPPTNPSLIYKFVRNMNDPEVAALFVDRYRPVIEKYLARVLRLDGPFEDLVQDIFVKIIRNLETFQHQGTGSFRAWLKKVVHSVHYDWLKEEKRRKDRMGPLEFMEPAFWDILPEEIALEYDKEIMSEAIRRVRLEIDPRTWEMFESTQIHGLQAEEVAKKFGVAIRTVYGASHRVLARLREMVAYLDQVK